MTEIEVELDEMKPAALFGGDYNTYVLWAVSPEGHVDNLGEFILRGNRSKLNVSTTLETFGLFVSAEPHFLVERPSRFVVLENSAPTRDIGPLKVSNLNYRGFEGLYNFNNETLANLPESQGEMRTHLEAARTSVELAERAGAEEYAPEELAKAREALRRAESGAQLGNSNQMLLGHEVVRLALDAEKLAQRRSFQAALENERQENAREISDLESRYRTARTEAERAALKAQQNELQARMESESRERAQLEAQEAARRAEQLAAEKQQAEDRLRDALSQVAEVRSTARGLIVSLPDILFEFDQATLTPQAREILAKLAGIFQVSPRYFLSIEGHTDSIGSEEYNMKLSMQRAESVEEYLVSQGIPESLVSSQGFGKGQPIASNDTAEGRQQNRRVEIVVQDTQSYTINLN